MRNRYRIGGILARGGMSVIYHAQDEHLSGAWVVKEMRPVTPSTEDRDHILEHFRREAAILATLSHPGLPRIIDSFEEAGNVYLVEEMLRGRTLYETASAHRFSEDDAVTCARELLEVLAYLHQHEIVYRDVKPQNVMVLDDGETAMRASGRAGARYVLVDFGIARLFSLGKRRDTVLMGTPGFASPEHYGNRQTDFRSDIYSLGALLHFLVTGRDPGERPFTFQPPDECAPGISEWFSDIVMKALETEPSERFQTALEMHAALDTPRHLVLRAQTFRYPKAPAFMPRWERPLQVVSAVAGGLGMASLLGSIDMLPMSMLLVLHPITLLSRYRTDWSMISNTFFVSLPRELQLWKGDRVTRIPWANISSLTVHKFQRLFRSRRDLGETRSGDTSIRVSMVELVFVPNGAAAPRRARFTNEIEGWSDLLAVIVSRAGLRREARTSHPLADEHYTRERTRQG